MKLSKKQIIWGAIVLIAIVVFVLYRRNKLSKQNIIAGSSPSPVKPVPSGSGSTPSRYVGTDFNKWKIGDSLVAVSPIVNIYSAPAITTSTIEKTINNGQLIGKFTGVSGNFAGVSYAASILGVVYIKTGYVFLNKAIGQSANVTNI